MKLVWSKRTKTWGAASSAGYFTIKFSERGGKWRMTHVNQPEPSPASWSETQLGSFPSEEAAKEHAQALELEQAA